MKLNVGSSCARGQYKRAEWINFDLNPQGRPNVVGDGFQMPFRDNTFDEIHSVHVLEHLPRDKWPLMLEEMFRTLKEGGTFYVEVPDFERQCMEFLATLEHGNRLDVHLVRTGMWGKSERPGMGHQFGFDKDLLGRALRTMGFRDIELLWKQEEMISTHWRSGHVLLARATKTDFRPTRKVSDMSFDEIREHIIK
jgi:predicted SAM-dependent methyltransferase